MKKTMTLIAAFAILFTSLSAAVDDRRTASYGNEAPAVVVDRDGTPESLEALRGKWVVLSFWSSTDPESRLAQNRIASIANRSAETATDGSNDAEIEFRTPAGVYTLGHDKKAEVLSVNLDNSELLMNEIVKVDNLLESTQTRVNSVQEISRLRQAFAMDNGLRTFIIDPDGNLAVADPTDAQLSLILASR